MLCTVNEVGKPSSLGGDSLKLRKDKMCTAENVKNIVNYINPYREIQLSLAHHT
jgi:hypothetical protein